MGKGKTVARCAWLMGLFLAGATVLHATLGMAQVMTAIKLGDIRQSFADIVRAVWIYSNIMLALSAVWAFFLAGELRQLKRRAWWQGLLLSFGYAGGSIGSMLVVGFEPELAVFALIGLLLLIPLIIWARHFSVNTGNNIKSTI